ncbi:hypothetical protein D3C72_152760 [compost metagenome]
MISSGPTCLKSRPAEVVELDRSNDPTRKAPLAQRRPARSRLISRDLFAGEDIEALTQTVSIPLLSLNLGR